MEKEKKCCGEDSLYGGAPSVFCDAVKSIENKRKYIKKILKPAEDASKDLEKATATDKVRLQGTAETKTPKLRPYTECKHVKDRKELSPLIEAAKLEHRPWKVERSKKEGFRYVFVTKVLKEEKLPKGATLKKDAGNVPLNVAHFNQSFGGAEASGVGEKLEKEKVCPKCGKEICECDKKLKEAKKEDIADLATMELDLDVIPEDEVDIPTEDDIDISDDSSKDSKEELTMEDIFVKYFDMHGNEDHSITVCLKGCEDKEDCPCITTEPLSDEEYELLKGEFHEDESEVEVSTEDGSEELTEEDEKFPNPKKNKLVDTYKGIDIYDCTCGKYVAMIDNKKVKKASIEDLKKCIDGKCESLKEESGEDYYYNYDITCHEYFNDGLIASNQEAYAKSYDDLCRKVRKEFNSTYEYSLREVEKYGSIEVVVNYSTDPKFKSEDEYYEDNLTEASSAEKRAFKNGGKDYIDLLVGRAIARIGNADSRKAAVASLKAKRPEVAKQFYGDRKLSQATDSVNAKQSKMADAGLHEQLLVEDDAVVSDDVEIKLDDLQYFKPVAGARETWQTIVDSKKVKDFANILKDFAKDGKMTTTDLNDMLWFEKDWVYDSLGIRPGVKHGDDVIDVDAEIKDAD